MLKIRAALGLFYKLALEHHGPKSIDLTTDVVIAFDELDSGNFRAWFDRLRCPFYGQGFNNSDTIAILQWIAISIKHNKALRLVFWVPFVATFWAHHKRVHGVGIDPFTFWAWG